MVISKAPGSGIYLIHGGTCSGRTKSSEIVCIDMSVIVVIEKREKLLDTPRFRVVLEHVVVIEEGIKGMDMDM